MGKSKKKRESVKSLCDSCTYQVKVVGEEKQLDMCNGFGYLIFVPAPVIECVNHKAKAPTKFTLITMKSENRIAKAHR